ncbi:hypothetical protein, conserved [Eimeria praecox]|uniref:tRNA:m(4)X modification enzyme TRM13 n=1 Tax=Eimeria praecox TaxID=51316 RepID=U6G3H7_9EIME|nr:hypothetical protein, conserved [Eimeria praecox]
MLKPAEEGGGPTNSGLPVQVPHKGDPDGHTTSTKAIVGTSAEALEAPLKRPKSGVEDPLESNSSLVGEAPTHTSASTTTSSMTSGKAAEGTASEAASYEATTAASGASGAATKKAAAGAATAEVPEGDALSRNRISSGRHGERIACPMDSSHSIYALRVQAHLKKCTKARDIAFSHCLPFMQPGINLPQQQQHDHSEQKEQQQGQPEEQQQQHADYKDNAATAAALTSAFEAKISEAYRYALSYLNNRHPIDESAASASAAAEEAAPHAAASAMEAAVWDSPEDLPASRFISDCYSSADGGDNDKSEEALLLLRAAADACKVPLDTGSTASKGPSLASLEAELKKALLLPRQDRAKALLEALHQLQQRLNKHQKQLLQLLALCLLHSHLQHSTLDETLIVELGAGKGDLTRWLCCWSAAAVAAAAQREPASAPTPVPAEVAAAGVSGAPSVRKGWEGASVGAPKQHRGVRCIVVDREARRYCKEAKDKTFRNPNAPRHLHPAAVAAAERRNAADAAAATTAVDKSSSLRNPLLGEEYAAGQPAHALSGTADESTVAVSAGATENAPEASAAVCATAAGCSNAEGNNRSEAALPVPPVRLRMDIADFSLVALVKPHIPKFFKKLFEYGCRFAAPGPAVGREGTQEAQCRRGKAYDERRNSVSKAEETTNVRQEEPTRAAARGPRPRLLRSIEDGSTEEFFAIAQTLGEGGGPSMEKIEDILKEHFRGRYTSDVLGVAKHLCTTESFVGTEFLLSQGFTLPEISVLFSLSGWATGATDRKRQIGNMVKRILDISRVWWLRQKGFTAATLQQFVESEETPECFAIVAHSHSAPHPD